MTTKKHQNKYICLILLFLISSLFPLFSNGVKNFEPNTCVSLKLHASVKKSTEIERHLCNVLNNFNSYPYGYNVDSSPYLTVNKIKTSEYQEQSDLFIASTHNIESKMLIIIAQ